MKKIRFSPLERLFAKTCKSKKDAIRLIKTFRREIEFPDGENVFLPHGLLLRFTLMVGFRRNPITYILGGSLSVVCYTALLINLFIK